MKRAGRVIQARAGSMPGLSSTCLSTRSQSAQGLRSYELHAREGAKQNGLRNHVTRTIPSFKGYQNTTDCIDSKRVLGYMLFVIDGSQVLFLSGSLGCPGPSGADELAFVRLQSNTWFSSKPQPRARRTGRVSFSIRAGLRLCPRLRATRLSVICSTCCVAPILFMSPTGSGGRESEESVLRIPSPFPGSF